MNISLIIILQSKDIKWNHKKNMKFVNLQSIELDNSREGIVRVKSCGCLKTAVRMEF